MQRVCKFKSQDVGGLIFSLQRSSLPQGSQFRVLASCDHWKGPLHVLLLKEFEGTATDDILLLKDKDCVFSDPLALEHGHELLVCLHP